MTISVDRTTTSYSSASNAQAVEQLFKAADTNSDGKITKSELTQAVESDTVEISSDGRTMSAGEAFSVLDSSGEGYITKQDVTSALEQSQSASGNAPAGGAARPTGGGGGGGGGGSTSATTDPADTNGDGEVSLQEEIEYLLKQYTQGTSTTEPQTEVYA